MKIKRGELAEGIGREAARAAIVEI